jgi:phosphoserine phosphatase
VSNDIVLVNVSGRNQPRLLGMLTSSLGRYQARILDVGEAVIHDELSLGLLVQIPGPNVLQQAMDDLSVQARAIGAAIRFTPISAADYDDWVAQQGKPRYIVTLLTGGITAEQFAAVTAIVERHGLSIDGIRRLSGRVPLDAHDATSRASIELMLRGELREPRKLKADLLSAASALVFDFSIQEDTVYRRNRRLVVLDMDSTLIQAEVIDELAKRHGVGPEVSAITERAMRGEIDFKASFRERVALLRGLPETALREVTEQVAITDGADRLISTLKHFGYRTAIVSGGFVQTGERLKRVLGIDHVYANELDVHDGHVTGLVRGEIIDAERKAQILRDICVRERIALAQAIAIGDGANDLPMLNVAGLGVAFHAKPMVRESANHAISNFGLDSVLYLIGFSDRDIEQAMAGQSTLDQSSLLKS